MSRSLFPVNRSLVNGLAGTRDHLEMKFVSRDLVQHEALVLVEAGGHLRRRLDVALAKLSACTGDEVEDSFLRLQAFVDMVVTGIDDVDAVLDKNRLQSDSEVDGGAVPPAIRIQRWWK